MDSRARYADLSPADRAEADRRLRLLYACSGETEQAPAETAAGVARMIEAASRALPRRIVTDSGPWGWISEVAR